MVNFLALTTVAALGSAFGAEGLLQRFQGRRIMAD
jgi:hypothetical protein